MKILAIDLGYIHTGLAISDENEIFAMPLKTIHQKNRIKLLDEIAATVKEYGVGEIVVGLPIHMDGTEGDSAKNAISFSDILSNQTGLDVFLIDERVTTILAHKYLNKMHTKEKKRKEIIDTVSAVIILQDYLEYKKNNFITYT